MPRRRPSRARRSNPELGAVYPTLDLHGETGDSARGRVERWLYEMREEGEPMVRVVTGRGKHSTAGPVLRGEIEHLLTTLRGGIVRRFEVDSGGGAFRVLLRLRDGAVAPRPRAAPPPPAPELRRRAEESLAELGVAPTPEMIAAEIERIRAAGAEER